MISHQDKARLNRPEAGSRTWFTGEEVELTGECEEMYGEVFYLGVYLTGHKEGKECCIASNLVERGFVRIS